MTQVQTLILGCWHAACGVVKWLQVFCRDMGVPGGQEASNKCTHS